MGDQKIVVIEDSLTAQEIIKSQLIEGGYSNLAFATTPEEGLELVSQEKPDLVIIDTVMPDDLHITSGVGLCKNIRDLHGEDIKIILMTGHAEYAIDDLKNFGAEVDGYAVKTGSGELLIGVVNDLLAA